LLSENARRWDTLSVADRHRVEALAHAVAQRLLEETAVRLAAAQRTGDDARVRAARDLLGLPGDAPVADARHAPSCATSTSAGWSTTATPRPTAARPEDAGVFISEEA
jgi:hypothetical protein